MIPEWLEMYVVVVVHVGIIPAVGYPLVWRWRGTWSHSRVGRALMRKAEALGILFVVSILNVWVPGVWWSYTYAVAVTWVVVTLYRQFGVLLLVLREQGRGDQ